MVMENERPFTIGRVAGPGSSITVAPMEIKCEWTELNLQSVYTSTCKLEDLAVATGYTVHKGYKGHRMKHQSQSAYMIPFRFATGGVLRCKINSSRIHGELSRRWDP